MDSSDSSSPEHEELVVVVAEPLEPVVVTSERVTVAGIEVDANGAIDPERLAKVTSGRRKIPLSMMFRPGGVDSAQSAGVDHYIAVVCYDTLNKNTIKISSLIFTGSTEAVLTIADIADNSPSIESFKGNALLILNPVSTGSTNLRIPSSRACLRLGTLSGLKSCAHENCSKPVLIDRDGALCYQHAVAAGVRVTTGGTSVTFDKSVSLEELEKRKREVKAHAPSADEKADREREQKRQELIAKKKTALLLLNRNSGAGRMEANARLSTGSLKEDMIDIGEASCSAAQDIEKLARLKELKRKRETLDKQIDKAAEKRKKENLQQVNEVVVPAKVAAASDDKGGSRKSLSEMFSHRIKSERGF